MHFHLPKPLHGWREFAGEVGIIVVGVLIALGAEQVVETAHWRSEVADFRGSLNSEVASDLAGFQYRLSEERCVSRRLAELQQWHDAAQAGTVHPLAREIGRPSILTIKTSVWESRADIMSHFPLSDRLIYSDLYNSFTNVSSQLEQEREAWRGLAAFNGATKLSNDNLMRLSELLYRARSIDWVLRANWKQTRDRAAGEHVRPDFGWNRAYIPPPDPEFCKPLISAGAP